MIKSEDKRVKGSDRREVSRMDAMNDRRNSLKEAKVAIISKEDIAKLNLQELEEQILANSLEVTQSVDDL